MCKECANLESFAKRSAKEDISDPGLSRLFDILDDVYSKWLRQSGADDNGICECFTCGHKDHFSRMQCGHFYSRSHKFLRYDPRQTKIQCPDCNEYRAGNIPEFRKRLELESPGIIEILETEVHLTYKYSRNEVLDLINEYRIKLKSLKK